MEKNFASDSFHEFANTYSFEQVTSCPTYAQSHGQVENAHKTDRITPEMAA